MGYISKNLKEIPDHYENYLIYLPAVIGCAAQKIFDSEFINLSKAIGVDNILIYIYDETEKERIINYLELNIKQFPILLYSSEHPEKAYTANNFINIELGRLKDEHEIYVFLEKMCWFLKSPDARREIEWDIRRQKFIKILKAMSRFLPGFGDIIGLSRP